MHPQAALSTLDRVIAKYRRDVHQLPTGATPDALTALEGHLSLPLPRGLKDFLSRHNGAHLFRGALRIRCTSDMTIASHAAPKVVLFADGVEGTPPWGWAMDEKGNYVFGLWDNQQLDPLHSTFEGWFCATLSLLETRVSRKEDQESLRFEADSGDVHQLVRAGVRALTRGNPDEARAMLLKATAKDPHQVEGWQ
ncbi:MAG: SMI1/KNR4 family protein, partial [Proteobacteria bacterium]|nr:SMI1/KNR4 family protein [Pseudomonadota bacterium]